MTARSRLPKRSRRWRGNLPELSSQRAFTAGRDRFLPDLRLALSARWRLEGWLSRPPNKARASWVGLNFCLADEKAFGSAAIEGVVAGHGDPDADRRQTNGYEAVYDPSGLEVFAWAFCCALPPTVIGMAATFFFVSIFREPNGRSTVRLPRPMKVSSHNRGEISWLPKVDPTNSTSRLASRATRITTRSKHRRPTKSSRVAVHAVARMSSM